MTAPDSGQIPLLEAPVVDIALDAPSARTTRKVPRKRAAAKPSKSGAYDATAIDVLEGLEPVRKRPGMYIGSTGQAGLQHLAWEVIDNSVDEAAAGHANRIDVILHADGSCQVIDNGRGIPVDKHPRYPKKSAAEVVFTVLHAGGKFSSASYAASGGLHGVGISVVNALSSKVDVVIDRDGKRYQMSFRNGGQVDKTLSPKGTSPKGHQHGTDIRFWPDTGIFGTEVAIDFDHARERLVQMSFLIPGTKITLTDHRTPDVPAETFLSKAGLVDFVEYLTPGPAICDVITAEESDVFTANVATATGSATEDRYMQVQVAFRWSTSYDTQVVSYVNTIPTADGGTHVAGFEDAMVKTVNSLLLSSARKLAKYGDKGKATRDDIAEGLVAVIRVTFPEPEFEGQTKGRLGTPAAKKLVRAATADAFSNWIASGKKVQVRQVTDKLIEAVTARVETRSALEAKRAVSAISSGSMPEKLADCRTHGPEAELIICEGDSAAGSLKSVRDSEFAAVLPIRGKILNVARATPTQVLKNAEIQAIITTIGAGLGRDFNLDDCRYGIVNIATDADVDGFHIQALLITFFYQFMRPLVECGRLHTVVTPLHAMKDKNETVYAYSDEERDEVIARMSAGRANPDITVTRFKGLGEMDTAAAFSTLVSREHRTLKRISVEDAVHASKTIQTLMGDSVEDRKAFIVRHAGQYGAEIDV